MMFSFRVKNGTFHITAKGYSTLLSLKDKIEQHFSLNKDEYYLTKNGRILSEDEYFMKEDEDVNIIVIPRLLGGKGGFGSMLRAIGAQIEKTTNREACRDLSGRRLRDINEEQRLKKWFENEKQREEEKKERKKKKLEKLKQFSEGGPTPLIEDKEYNKQRAEMADSVFDAVDAGFKVKETEKASSSKSSSDDATNSNSEEEVIKKVKVVEKPKEKKIKKTMMDEDLDSDVSSSEEEEEIPSKKQKLSA